MKVGGGSYLSFVYVPLQNVFPPPRTSQSGKVFGWNFLEMIRIVEVGLRFSFSQGGCCRRLLYYISKSSSG